MQPYGRQDGRSGVTHYAIGPDYIDVVFRRSSRVYRYSHARAGQIHVERMKKLAEAGQGLTTYISKYVHDLAD